ncbi:MAG: hypothetical protein ACYS6Z_16185, partial [Planctomycetota bacterium]
NFKSGARTVLKGEQILLWRDFGEYPLIAMGKPALDLLLAEDRLHEYGTALNILAGVLRILPRIPGAREHERLYPFLSYWLDPAHLPSPTERANWAEDIRQQVFKVFGAFPAPAAVPFCLEEMERKERVHDLRRTSLAVLLATGNTGILVDLFDQLPPNADEAAPDLRIELIVGLYRTAAPRQGSAGRALVAEMEPVLREAIASEREAEQLNATSVLLRLGYTEMEGRLIEIYETALASGGTHAAWSALLLLNKDQPHPYVRARCLEQLEHPSRTLGFEWAARLVCRWWPEEKAALETIWAEIERRENLNPMFVLPTLVKVERDRVVAYLKGELESGATRRVGDALNFVVGERLTELGPVLLDLVREFPRLRRPMIYRPLVMLGTPGTEALLLAEMANRKDEMLRRAAAAELMNLGGRRGLAHLAEELERGDPIVLRALFMRAKGHGRAGVPESLVGPALRALRVFPDEDDRRTALFIFRYRGTLDGAREGLVEAYRREPSRRLATEIRQVLEELAHR